jgi:hypothetical protein
MRIVQKKLATEANAKTRSPVIRRRSRITALLSTLFLLVACVMSATSLAAQHQIFVKSETSALSMPTWVDKELGLFDKYGVNVVLLAMSGGALGMRALLFTSCYLISTGQGGFRNSCG